MYCEMIAKDARQARQFLVKLSRDPARKYDPEDPNTNVKLDDVGSSSDPMLSSRDLAEKIEILNERNIDIPGVLSLKED